MTAGIKTAAYHLRKIIFGAAVGYCVADILIFRDLIFVHSSNKWFEELYWIVPLTIISMYALEYLVDHIKDHSPEIRIELVFLKCILAVVPYAILLLGILINLFVLLVFGIR